MGTHHCSQFADKGTEWLIRLKNAGWKNNLCSIFVVSNSEVARRNSPFWHFATEIFLICFINLIFLILATVIIMLLEEIKGLYTGFPI